MVKIDKLENTIEVISIKISDNLEHYDYLRSILNNQERERADRFYFQKDRNCYTIARGILKLKIANYLNISANEIVFKYNSFGKPFLDQDLKFNISHSLDFILLAFTLNNQIGVDIEFMKENIKYKELIKRYFSQNEINNFLLLDEYNHREAFFNVWSRKEAYIKAVGRGLNIALDSFDVSVNNDESEIISIDNKINNTWKLFSFNIDSNYKSALAIDNFDKKLNILKFYFKEL